MDRLGLKPPELQGHPKTVSERRQAAIVRDAGHPTQEEAKTQACEPDARLYRPFSLIQSFSLLRHSPPRHPNKLTLHRASTPKYRREPAQHQATACSCATTYWFTDWSSYSSRFGPNPTCDDPSGKTSFPNLAFVRACRSSSHTNPYSLINVLMISNDYYP